VFDVLIRRARVGVGVFVALLALGLMAAACGDDGPGYGGSSGTATPKAAASASTSGGSAATSSAAASNDDPYGYGSTGSSSATTAPATGSSTVKVGDTSKGKVLTDGAGMTLYTYNPDAAGSGKSVCTGGCLAEWPAVIAMSAPSGVSGASGAFALIKRDDGSMQVSYKGKPLYRFVDDKAPGDATGDGMDDFALARP
jgi:predicted lipoprotein with Yx(FWY)xxD motif